LKNCGNCYGFLREQKPGYRNAAIGFKGSDKPERPRDGQSPLFFSLENPEGDSCEN
jgi:hypothetical protein